MGSYLGNDLFVIVAFPADDKEVTTPMAALTLRKRKTEPSTANLHLRVGNLYATQRSSRQPSGRI